MRSRKSAGFRFSKQSPESAGTQEPSIKLEKFGMNRECRTVDTGCNFRELPSSLVLRRAAALPPVSTTGWRWLDGPGEMVRKDGLGRWADVARNLNCR